MSVNYAAGLSYCDDLGVCGLEEVTDKPDVVKEKVSLLANWLRHYDGSCVVHVGAGLSTAAGIRDFRGKKGVWTELQRQQLQSQTSSTPTELVKLEKKEPKDNDERDSDVKPFDETVPTCGHMAVRALCELGLVRHIVSQNVDGLFLRSNLKRKFISELHGNFYLNECTKCRSRYIRSTSSPTMKLQKSSVKCPRGSENIHDSATKSCKGHLRDTILDWESPIPYNELRIATKESRTCKLHICIGTSLQLRPSKDLVCHNKNKEKSKKLVIINLQETKFDHKADLVIHYYADDVMRELFIQLNHDIPNYDEADDPTRDPNLIGTMWKK